MSFLNNEGPTILISQTCVGCQWHSEDLLISGKAPIYEHHCKHPTTVNQIPGSMTSLRGDYIGKSPRTPVWCPIISEKRSNQDINNDP